MANPAAMQRSIRAARRECEEEAGLRLDGPLQWFDTWKTPSAESRRRYLARFYVAHVQDDAHAESASHDGEESVDGRWGTAAEFLAEWEAGECDLPPPTLAILGRVAADSLASMMARPDADLTEPILPRIGSHKTVSGGVVAVLLPHDADYDSGIGESGPCPPRAHDYPTRFARIENRWVPIRELQ